MDSDEEILAQLQAEQGAGPMADTMSAQAYHNMQNQDSGNLIVWQLELDNILERIEHLLRGDIIKDDGSGGYNYTVPEDKSLIVLNDYGVGLIMNFVSFYLNRNTILSNYDLERIYEILHDLGYELSDLIYINYEKMGLDTAYKRSRSTMFTMNILHMIESSYMRALKGEERDSLRKARIVTQNQPLAAPASNSASGNGFTLNPLKRMMGG